MEELLATIQVQAEIIWSLRRDKLAMAQEIERLSKALEEATKARGS